MADEPLAQLGNVLHVYDFRVKPGSGDEFIELFNKFDYSGNNPMHKSPAQIKDGVLCRDAEDPDHFYLIGEWRSIEEHKAIRDEVVAQFKAERSFTTLIEGGKFAPTYATVVSATPANYLKLKR